ELKLAGASVEVGVPWEDLFGGIACRGRYEGTHVGLVCGNAWLDRAVVARQPVGTARFRARAEPQRPDPTRPGYYLPTEVEFRDLAGDLFHGVLGGEARVGLADPPRYDVCLGGSGEVDTTGEYVKFEFYTLGSQILAKLVNTPVGDFSTFLSRNLFLKIKLTRENGELKYRAEAVPLVTEPTKAVIDRLRTGAGRLMGKGRSQEMGNRS